MKTFFHKVHNDINKAKEIVNNSKSKRYINSSGTAKLKEVKSETMFRRRNKTEGKYISGTV